MTTQTQTHIEILNQLGGRKFLAMTGTKNLVYCAKENNYLLMKLTRNMAGAQYLKITLTIFDTYIMTFSKINNKTGEVKTVKEIKNVYCDELQTRFTEVTGLRTSL
jgi:hypothetical protein